MFEVGKIHQLPPPLFLRVLPVKFPKQREQRTDRPRRILEVGKYLRARRIEAHLRVLERRKRLLADVLDRFLQLRVLRAAHGRDASKAQQAIFIDLVPALACLERGNSLDVIQKFRRVFFLQYCVARHGVNGLLQIFPHPCRRFPQTRNERPAPRCLRSVRRILRCIGLLAPAHPCIRVNAAANRTVDRQHQLCQPPVVAAVAELVDERPKRTVLCQIFIALLQQRVQHLLLQLLRLQFLRHAKIRRNVQRVRIFAQDGGAERMYGGDLRQIDARELAL